jgi:hypothetical protein
LSLFISGMIYEDIVTRYLYKVWHIQELCLFADLCYFNLDNLVNLRVLEIGGVINNKFNFKLFKNLCNQLEVIKINIYNSELENFFKLFDGFNFPYLVDFTIESLFF